MAYNTANPPRLFHQTPGGAGDRNWHYRNTDTLATVNGAGYFTNGRALGMNVTDVVTYIKTDGPNRYVGMVTAIDGTTGAATVVLA